MIKIVAAIYIFMMMSLAAVCALCENGVITLQIDFLNSFILELFFWEMLMLFGGTPSMLAIPILIFFSKSLMLPIKYNFRDLFFPPKRDFDLNLVVEKKVNFVEARADFWEGRATLKLENGDIIPILVSEMAACAKSIKEESVNDYLWGKNLGDLVIVRRDHNSSNIKEFDGLRLIAFLEHRFDDLAMRSIFVFIAFSACPIWVACLLFVVLLFLPMPNLFYLV